MSGNPFAQSHALDDRPVSPLRALVLCASAWGPIDAWRGNWSHRGRMWQRWTRIPQNQRAAAMEVQS
jgi:hypothetical protein